MRMRRWVGVAATAAAFAMLVACSDVSSTSAQSGTSGSGAAVPDNSGTTITLAINAWVGSEANAEATERTMHRASAGGAICLSEAI